MEKLYYFRLGWGKKRDILTASKFKRANDQKKYVYLSKLLTLGHLLTSPLPKTKFLPQSEGAGHKSRASCLQDLFSQWVIPTEAWPILNEMAVGQQIPAGHHCIIQLFWTHASVVSELAAAIELLLLPICTQRIERLLQPCPHCLLSILPWANWAQEPRQCFQLCIKPAKGFMLWWHMVEQNMQHNIWQPWQETMWLLCVRSILLGFNGCDSYCYSGAPLFSLSVNLMIIFLITWWISKMFRNDRRKPNHILLQKLKLLWPFFLTNQVIAAHVAVFKGSEKQKKTWKKTIYFKR